MNNKLKSNSGSAMILAIFSVITVSLLGIYITNQIGNQLKSSKNTYENMQTIYLAESSIEKTIYDLENQIYNKLNTKVNNRISLYSGEWVNTNHIEHTYTKVKYEKEGKVDYSSFNKLIFEELLNTNGSKDTFWGLHNNVIKDLESIGGTSSTDFKSTTDILWQQGGFLKDTVHNSEVALSTFVSKVNDSIRQLDNAKKIYESKLPDEVVEERIDRLNRLNGVFEEILCRLGILKDDAKSIPINIKLYSRTMNREGEITKEDVNIINKDIEGKDLVVKFIYKENKLYDINFDKLNEVLDNGIYGEGILKNNTNTVKDIKKIYKIRFGFNNGKINHNITYIENE